MRALLQLDDYWIDTLEIQAVKDLGERPAIEDGVLPRLQFHVFGPEDQSYLVDMSVVLGQAKAARGAPYRLRLKLSGVFSFLPDTPEDVQVRMIHVNGPAILYGIARGVVAEATGAGRYGKYVLPSVDLLEMADRQLARGRVDDAPGPQELEL